MHDQAAVQTDALTGLATLSRLRGLDAGSGRWSPAPQMTVFVIDVDRFRFVNDLMGYELGDGLLRAIGKRLAAWAAPNGIAARISADVFAIVCPGSGGDTAAGAHQIGDLVATAVDLDGRVVSRTASIGYASGAIGVERVQDLYRRADEAMRVVKSGGGNAQRAFEPSMSDRAVTVAAIEMHLRSAVDTGALHLVFQPEIDLRTGALLGVEALVRWQHPTLGPLLPDQFLDIAEDANVMPELGGWVLRESCRRRASWDEQLAGRPLLVRVNLSATQLVDDHLIGLVRDVLAETGLPADQLCLEITERVMPQDIRHVAAVLGELRATGVTTAIDDFGTGHNSLTYLRAMPVDTLKIDRSFVAGLGVDDGDAVIVEALIRLAERLRLSVVAEGIETESELFALLRMGCHRGQGHLLSKALGADDLQPLLRSGRLATAAFSNQR